MTQLQRLNSYKEKKDSKGPNMW